MNRQKPGRALAGGLAVAIIAATLAGVLTGGLQALAAAVAIGALAWCWEAWATIVTRRRVRNRLDRLG